MNYMHLTNYPLEYFQTLFSPDRWSKIVEVVNNWVHPELKDGRIYTSILMNPETLATFNVGAKDKVDGHMMEYMQKQVLEKYLSEEEVKMCNDKAMSAYCGARDRREYDAATKIEEKDWNDEPIFYGDTFYSDGISQLRDEWDYDHPLPEYVHGYTKHYTLNGCDIEHAVDILIERVGDIDDGDYVKIPNIPEYLQEAWDKFVDENAQEYYLWDKKKVILLDKELNEQADYEANND